MTNLATLADAYIAAKAELDALEAKVKALRSEIVATGYDKIEGTYGAVTVGLSERTSFDNKVAKTFLTDEQIAACNKTSLIETIRIKHTLPMAA